MKYIVNADFTGYIVPNEIVELLGLEDNWVSNHAVRTNPLFIQWVEAHANETDLRVVEIPEEATDYAINNYDGLESIYAVVNGKIQRIIAN